MLQEIKAATGGAVVHRGLILFAFVTASALLSMFQASQGLAQSDDSWTARLVSVQGVVEVRRAGRADWLPARLHDELEVGDSVRIHAFSRAAIRLPDETILRLDQNTQIIFAQPEDAQRTWLELLKGIIHVISRDPRALKVITPFANAGLEGTEFLVIADPQFTRIDVFEGEVAISNAAGAITIKSGESALVEMGQAPVARAIVRPRDAVQWTLYYPPIIGYDLPAADAEPGPERIDDPRFYTGRASRRLAVGRVEEARDDISRALSIDSGNVDALALMSIIALTQDRKDEAKHNADEALKQDPQSSAALIALSYVQQAAFDLPAALATLQKAVKVDPENALAWSRLSELWLTQAELKEALDAADIAVSKNPRVGRTQTVLGFALLLEDKIAEAVSTFNHAIDLDDAAPLPHLGLGLALIRDGKLAAGREQIEFAVILDPGNALVRSYMGKAYYDEKRDELAESQYEFAKRLDDLDPTAWFYDAIRKQTSNRPGEALQDIQKSIDNNDNRAVYRSRLLLDEDLAARSAGLARIYRDLGFEKPALVEGWKSVNTDPSDYSGHRFLADSYSALPLRQIARVNELYVSQLLQPININPIQPQLAEANLFILDNAGPAQLSFNEFNPLFHRNRFAFQGSGVVGGNGTRGRDLAVAGINDGVSFSVGNFYFETDGFRVNNDFEQDVWNGFVQLRASSKTSVLAELRSSKIEKGDLDLLFDPTDFNPSLRLTEDVDSARIGGRHAFSGHSILLASFIYQEASTSARTTVPISFSGDEDYHSLSADLQHIYRRQKWHVITGLNHLGVKSNEFVRRSATVPFPPFVVESTSSFSDDIDVLNAYVYTTLRGVSDVSITLGGSYDAVKATGRDDDWFNPKLGLMWDVGPTTTLRAAAFQTVQSPFISKQNIQPRLEPTQVAGFNQFFYGADGEVVEHYGVAIDHSFSAKLYTGLQLTQREIDFPWVDATTLPPTPVTVPVDREVASGYVNYLPTSRWALAASVLLEDSDNNGEFLGEGFSELRTKRFPLQVTYFNPSGFSAKLVATYADQKGTFQDFSGPPPFSAVTMADSFWVVDASIGYRLPKRYGVISVNVYNVLDEEFQFQDSDPENPRIFPERFATANLTLAF